MTLQNLQPQMGTYKYKDGVLLPWFSGFSPVAPQSKGIVNNRAQLLNHLQSNWPQQTGNQSQDVSVGMCACICCAPSCISVNTAHCLFPE